MLKSFCTVSRISTVDIAGNTWEMRDIAEPRDISEVRDIERIWIMKSFPPIRVTPGKSPIFCFSLSPFPNKRRAVVRDHFHSLVCC